jgi:hypothetical protein|tara:strand:+ start:143 stop:877 length:735 start_codon:yes stop_codon:yes gene_type:complete
MNYYNNYDINVEGTYIISIQGNKVSEKLTQQCLASCEKVGQPNVRVFPAFDATDSPIKIQDHDLGKPIGEMGTIKVPEMLKGQAFINFLRLRRADLLMTQIACFLSHYSLWCMCLDKDKPIVILEHDAMMVKQYLTHNYYNNIVYMGGVEQHSGTMGTTGNIPPHASDQKGLDRFICRAHAYAIDPAIAKNLVAYSIHHGLITTADAIMRCDMFGIVQDGVYAYDNPNGLSTITEDGRVAGYGK